MCKVRNIFYLLGPVTDICFIFGEIYFFMAKSSKKKVQSGGFSEKKYIRERVRNLPVEVCYYIPGWEESGETSVLVVRRHPQGTLTVGAYLVDTWCTGVKDTWYVFSIPQDEFDDILDRFPPMEEIGYAEVHNLILGAVEFAEEAGIAPHRDFALTQFILDEDGDDVPLIEYVYGRDGRHFLCCESRLEASRYLPALEKNVPGAYDYVIDDGDDDELDECDESEYDFVE